ncbi:MULTISPECIES: serine O-acetyltransferase [Deefgea]|uniref:Serine acetyltransferase n=1 Tax=Deefgea chitinilytica TaxID=570276 RepID=A0ABS2CEB7_9NEIS|nr:MULTISPECIES: serine acetyltransferase [Deefgea]MBM5572347.1 serine acetyltransferase [Deefgea chitinilytica]MBM9889583.1 serine acetyltransferase [Deefgea sp. CFH1-16]
MKIISTEEFNSYRTAKLGLVNRVINFTFQYIPVLNVLIKYLLHLDLPRTNLNGLRLGHPFGIVINPGCSLGKNITIFQGVTLGSKRTGSHAGAPIIADNVIVFPNSVIIGRISIGKNAVIGAGSIVVSDVPDFAVVAGNPAVVIGMQGK